MRTCSSESVKNYDCSYLWPKLLRNQGYINIYIYAYIPYRGIYICIFIYYYREERKKERLIIELFLHSINNSFIKTFYNI